MDREFGGEDYDPDDRGSFTRGLVFVMMSFQSEDSNEVFAAVKEECQHLELNATRVDEEGGSGLIIRDVVRLIENAEFLVCDLSYERPNVYYELGYAHGVGNEADEILLIARTGTKLHFDIAPLRVWYYADNAELRKILARQLRRMISVTR